MKSVTYNTIEITFTLRVSATGKFAIHRMYIINKEVIGNKENHYCNTHKTYTF